MINIGTKGGSAPDPRVDKAIERIEDTRKEIFDTDAWVEEIEQKIDVLAQYIKTLPKHEPVDVPNIGPLVSRIKALEDAPPPPPARPMPLIPDISPVYKRIAELKLKIEEVQVDYNSELTNISGILREIPGIKSRLAVLENTPPPKPDLTLVYNLLGAVSFVSITLFIVGLFI